MRSLRSLASMSTALVACAACAACAASPASSSSSPSPPASDHVPRIVDASTDAPSSAIASDPLAIPHGDAPLASGQPPLPAPTPEPSVAVEGGATAKAVPAACPKPGLFLEVTPTRTRCSASSSSPCTAAVPLRILNCTGSPLVPASIVTRRASSTTAGPPAPLASPSPLLPKHRLEGLSVRLVAGEKWTLDLAAESTQTPGMFTSARAADVDVIDQTRVDEERRAKAERASDSTACRARGGRFEIVGGLMATETCVFPFADAGKVCHDKADCRGECLMTRAVILPSGDVRLDGKCTRLEVEFGCHARIGATPHRKGIVKRSEIPPSMCVD